MITPSRYIPLLSWLPNYDRAHLRGDLTAGLTTAVMLVPQGMAYAMLAGLPPIVGLYASVVPQLVYAVFGTSRQLAVGPVAMDSLMVAATVGAIAQQGSDQYVTLAVLLGLLVGVVQLAMGALRLGFLVNFLSRPVISGFTSAAALVIGFSQLKYLLGFDIPRSKHVHTILIDAISRIEQTHLVTLAIGVASIGVLRWVKKHRPQVPGALVVVVASTLIVWGFGLYAGGVDGDGVAIVGAVPAGLPVPALVPLDMEQITVLMPSAVAIALIAFMEAISVANAFATRKRYEVDANQELVALGLANIGGAFFRGYPVTGGFSRTAVNGQAGAETPLAAIVTALAVAVTLLFLTPLFFYLPKAVLAAIIFTAVFGLIDLAHVKHLWKVKKDDLALLVLTFVATLTVGIGPGILTGVCASLAWFVVKTTRPHTAVLGHLPGTTSYRNIANYPEAQVIDGVLILRIDAQFYFGNVSFLKERLEALVTSEIRVVILDCSGVNQLDSSADEALHGVLRDLRDRRVHLMMSNVKWPVRTVLERSGFTEAIGTENIALTVHHAVGHLQATGRLSPRTEPAPSAGLTPPPTNGRPRPDAVTG